MNIMKVDQMEFMCHPRALGLTESLLERQNSFSLRQCLTAGSIKHFLELFAHFQGHFPFLHIPTFNFLEANDGVVLALICIGAVYSDRISQNQVRDLMQLTKNGTERTSRLLNSTEPAIHLSSSGQEVNELQALLMLTILDMWHGGPAPRADARESMTLFLLARRLDLLELPLAGFSGFNYLHHISQVDSNRWS